MGICGSMTGALTAKSALFLRICFYPGVSAKENRLLFSLVCLFPVIPLSTFFDLLLQLYIVEIQRPKQACICENKFQPRVVLAIHI